MNVLILFNIICSIHFNDLDLDILEIWQEKKNYRVEEFGQVSI